ncbi:MAG TPA: bifunctional ADP-heptose synthase [Actinomycetota bacterium]|nr:bifunctional ADP-heptose synthase [Actinomycetota bacterium]
MSAELSRVVDSFERLQVAVIGDAMLDTYMHGTADRLSREAPVPIVTLEGAVDVPGGAANTAVNAAELGASVRLLTVVGEDDEGALLRKELERLRVGAEDVIADPSRWTLAKRRISAQGQQLLRFDRGSTAPVEGDAEDELVERVRSVVPRCDAIIVSDYGYGVVTRRVVDAIVEARREGAVVVVDAKDLRRYRRVHATAVKPNYEEAVRLLGEHEVRGLDARAEQLTDRGDRLLELTGADAAAVTLDTEGALLFEHGRPPYRTFARHTRLARPAGAGDTFVATLALAFAAGATSTAAAELASAASGVVIEKDGTSACAGSSSASTSPPRRSGSLTRNGWWPGWSSTAGRTTASCSRTAASTSCTAATSRISRARRRSATSSSSG